MALICFFRGKFLKCSFVRTIIVNTEKTIMSVEEKIQSKFSIIGSFSKILLSKVHRVAVF